MPAETARGAAVLVDGVSKTFRLPHERSHTLKERALHPFRRSGHEQLRALRDVSFAVAPGEFFGIVGRNGSGKSTLLKCLAGIYRVDGGRIFIDGRVSTFIELGVGFNPDLAARENVILNGTMLGLTPAEARRRYDSVIEFAELEEFADLKLKNYSSGMHVRLAFSVMIQVDADVLLIDEVLAVGDAGFQQKCFEVFQRLRDEGRTILFVTHDMGAVRRFCHRALLIERGEVRMIGDPDAVGSNYLEVNFGRGTGERGEDGEERYGTQAAEIVDAWFEDENGQRADGVHQGRTLTLRMRIRFHERVKDPVPAFLIENEQHHPLFATSSEDGNEMTGQHEPGDETVFSISLTNPFAPGRIYATPWIVQEGTADVIDRRPRLASVVVAAVHRSGALVDLPHDMTYERVAGAPAAPARSSR
jgi:ABC-type polysaccharide/polyol phosphate transport system ATPase subunit